MRLGGPVEAKNPEEWVKQLIELGYTAGILPKDIGINEVELQKAYVEVAEKENIIIAEVGAWSNPISTDEKERSEAIQYCQKI